MKEKARLKPAPRPMKQSGKRVRTEELRETYSAKEKAELLLSNLEKLKTELSATEARYNLLTADYSKICEDAILKISAIKVALEKDLESKAGDLEIPKPGMSNLNARFKLGLVSVETYLKQKESESIAPTTKSVQLLIDRAGDSIEFGLDKIGDGIIFLGDKIINAASSMSKAVTRRR